MENLVDYKGAITQEVITSCMASIEENIAHMVTMANISTIVIEMSQNMMNYSKTKDSGCRAIESSGQIKVEKDIDGSFFITGKNIVSIEDKEKIEQTLLDIISLDKAGIKKRYRELRKSGQNTHAKGGGIGSYEIAKVCNELEYDFESINEDKYYYRLSVKVFSKVKRKKTVNISSLTILIVEDSKAINNAIFAYLDNQGYKCFSAFTLAQANSIIESEKIDYIMLDMNLPDGSGFTLISELEQSSKKIFVLTGDTNDHLRAMSYNRGVVDFINKDENLLTRIEQIPITINQLELNKSRTILIVEDSPIDKQTYINLFENRNYKVQLIPNIEDSIDIIKEKDIELLLISTNLKNTNSIKFLREYKYLIIDLFKIPTILLSNNLTGNLIRDGFNLGVKETFKTPVLIEELIVKSELWISNKSKELKDRETLKTLNEYKNTIDESAMVSKTDPSGKITYVNKEFCKLSGYSSDELIGKNHNIIRHIDTPISIYKDMWHTIHDLKQPWRGEIKNRKKDGSHYWVKSFIKPILDLDRNITEYIAIRVDITESKRGTAE